MVDVHVELGSRRMKMFENSQVIVSIVVAAVTGSVVGVLATLFSLSMKEDTRFVPAANYGIENTWFHMIFWDKTQYEGDMCIRVISGLPQNTCNNIKNSPASDGKSIRLYDRFNPDSYLPTGMKVILFWGRKCSDWRPYGVITVPPNVKEVRVPNLNKSSANYEVFNNFHQSDGGERELAGHVNGYRWSLPDS